MNLKKELRVVIAGSVVGMFLFLVFKLLGLGAAIVVGYSMVMTLIFYVMTKEE